MNFLKYQKCLFSKEKGNYYRVLKVSKSSSFEQIRRQYLKLAKKFHPDLNHKEGSQEKFQQIQRAFEVLSSKTERQKYNQKLGIMEEWDADIKELQFQNEQDYEYYENLYQQNLISKDAKLNNSGLIQESNIIYNTNNEPKQVVAFIGYILMFGFLGILNVIIQKVFIGKKYDSKYIDQRTKEDLTAEKKGYVPRLMPL